MNEMAHDAWFYTRQGERCGPVAYAELQMKAKEAALDPRLDMVWTQGMDAWKTSGEIEGLFEKPKPPEPKESLAPAADPYTPPQQTSVAEVMAGEGGWPGARRRSFLFLTMVFPFLWSLGLTFGMALLTEKLGPEIMGVAGMAAAFVPMIVGIYIGLQRLANLGMSRWWYLGNFVPILNFWVGYRCFACPAGYAYHKKLDGAGIALAIIYWLVLVAAILAAIAILALMFGMIGDPELQDQIREAMRKAGQQAPAQ